MSDSSFPTCSTADFIQAVPYLVSNLSDYTSRTCPVTFFPHLSGYLFSAPVRLPTPQTCPITPSKPVRTYPITDFTPVGLLFPNLSDFLACLSMCRFSPGRCDASLLCFCCRDRQTNETDTVSGDGEPEHPSRAGQAQDHRSAAAPDAAGRPRRADDRGERANDPAVYRIHA